MATIELTKDNLDDTIKSNDILLIDFWAEWCGPCKMFGPIFEKASEKYPDIKFAKCDTEAQQEVAGSFGIRSIPTLAIFRDQILVFMQPGALPEAALEDVIEQTRKLDMDEVRAKIAEEEAKQKADKKE
jgi:thioredoxin 1